MQASSRRKDSKCCSSPGPNAALQTPPEALVPRGGHRCETVCRPGKRRDRKICHRCTGRGQRGRRPLVTQQEAAQMTGAASMIFSS